MMDTVTYTARSGITAAVLAGSQRGNASVTTPPRRSEDPAGYERWRQRQIAYGRWQPYVDAEPVRAHVRELQAAGLGWKRIADLAGVQRSVMHKLLYGDAARHLAPSKRVRPATAEKILAVRASLDVVGSSVLVDASGTQRRLRALVAVGWSQSKLAARLGKTPTNLGRCLAGDRVQAGTARAVRVLYDELWDQTPAEDTHHDKIAASRARGYAAARGWAPPLAWDDDTIDDPDASPAATEPAPDDVDELAVARAVAGERTELTRAELEVAVARLHATGLNDSQIGARLHIGHNHAGYLRKRVLGLAAVPDPRSLRPRAAS